MSPTPQIFQRGALSPVSRVLQSGRVWAIQGVGTILWLALARTCLLIGTDGAWRLAASIVLAIFLSYLAAFLQRTALRVYRHERLAVWGSRRKVRRREILDWLPDAALVFALLIALAGLDAVIQQALPIPLRQNEWPGIILGWLFFVLFWLPIAGAALLGERGMWRAAVRAWGSPRYWLGTLVSFVAGNFAVRKLARWALSGSGLARQSPGKLAQLALGYAIALGAWLVILAFAEESISSVQPRSVDDTWD